MTTAIYATRIVATHPCSAVEHGIRWSDTTSPDAAHRDVLASVDCPTGASLGAVAALLAADYTRKGTPRAYTRANDARKRAATRRFWAESDARAAAYAAVSSRDAG